MSYLSWDTQTISDFSNETIHAMYQQGYVFTRKGKGEMDQTRSVRIDLSQFELTSENRRILRKCQNMILAAASIPYAEYDWSIGKLAKDFYDTKFGKGTFSANKIKEIMTDRKKSNFNLVFRYGSSSLRGTERSEVTNQSPSVTITEHGIASVATLPRNDETVGYCIALETNRLLHYSYPFYSLDEDKNIGMGMMLQAIQYAKENGKTYIYLGSAQRPTDTYKLQFAGLEWFDGTGWSNNLETLKQILDSDV